MKINKVLISFLSFLLFLSFFSMFIVHEGQRGIILKFGKVVRDSNKKIVVYHPGLHFKLPFLETVTMLDSRTKTIDNQFDRFITKEKKDLIIDFYIKWRINDFDLYYLTTRGRDIFQIEELLKRKFSNRLRSEINRLNIKDIISDSKGKIINNIFDSLNKNVNNSKNIISMNENSINKLGVQIIDIRIKQINLPIEVSDMIYNHIRIEKESFAKNQRIQGIETAEKLRAVADYKVSTILAKAQKAASNIKGIGEAKVIKLLMNNFQEEPDFYFFIRALRAYENIFKNNKNILILKLDNEFFQYMNKIINIEK